MSFFSPVHPARITTGYGARLRVRMSAAWTRLVHAARHVPAPIATMVHPAVAGPGLLRVGQPNAQQPMVMTAALGGRPWHPDQEQAACRGAWR
ncbi:MAG TPA: hypothetical protein VG247_17030 [Pseudonocardiaceae bacterium]|jgi:hypothetical protein|nr:hypothetical protein [Pseudonocardiaceae bacterium]